jgi:hypothetical protein
MLRQHNIVARLIAVGLSASVLVPATAAASPAQDPIARTVVAGQSVAAGGGPGVTIHTLRAPRPATSLPDLRAPDQVSGDFNRLPTTGPQPPQWPVDPQPIVDSQPTGRGSTGGGDIDTAWLIALGGAALAALAGAGAVAVRRQRQPA